MRSVRAWRTYGAGMGRQRRVDRDAKRRAGRSPARRARELQLELLRELRWGLAALAAICTSFTVAALLFSHNVLITFAVGVFDASVIWLLALFVIEATGCTTWRLGAEAESWTADEIAKLGSGWRTVHAIGIGSGDVDHVVIGPPGVFALETKRKSSPWTRADLQRGGRVDGAKDQAQRSAKAVRSRLRSYDREVEVTAVVVLWGRTQEGVLGDGGRIAVVHGSDLRRWLCKQPVRHQAVDVDGVADTLGSYLGSLKENQEGGSRFVAVGAGGVASDISSGVAGGIAGIVLGSFALAATWMPFKLRVVTIAGLLLVGASIRRWTQGRRRLFGLGLGLASAIVLALLAALLVGAWATGLGR